MMDGTGIGWDSYTIKKRFYLITRITILRVRVVKFSFGGNCIVI